MSNWAVAYWEPFTADIILFREPWLRQLRDECFTEKQSEEPNFKLAEIDDFVKVNIRDLSREAKLSGELKQFNFKLARHPVFRHALPNISTLKSSRHNPYLGFYFFQQLSDHLEIIGLRVFRENELPRDLEDNIDNLVREICSGTKAHP